MVIKITPSMLCDLCNGKFTLEGAEAICEYFEENDIEQAPMIGDICICFEEIPSEYVQDYEKDNIIANLDNGNVIVAW